MATNYHMYLYYASINSVLSLRFGEEIIVTNAQLSAKTYVANL